MKQPIIKDYSWIDIIEPETGITSISAWESVGFVLFALILCYFIFRKLNIYSRFRIWQIKRELHKTNNTRICAKQLLDLLCLNRNISTELQTEIALKKDILINACYSKKEKNVDFMLSLLKSLARK